MKGLTQDRRKSAVAREGAQNFNFNFDLHKVRMNIHTPKVVC